MRYGKASMYVVVVAASLFTFWGCPKKAEVNSASEAQAVQQAEAKATEAAAAARAAEDAKEKERAAAASSGLQPVYFDFDRSNLRDNVKAVLASNVEWLKAHPQANIRIEGNCDERGTKEYNQTLGQRRAVSAKTYLTAMGVSADRISLVSYGKEKQICTENNEECWQKNRRDDFVVVTQ